MKQKECDICHKEFPEKKLKRISREWRCKHCCKNKRKEREEYLKREVLGITKEQEKEERKIEKRNYNQDRCSCGNLKSKVSKKCMNCYEKESTKKKEERERQDRNSKPPKIKGQKERKTSKQLHFYLTSNEKEFLYKKYLSKGLEKEEIKEKLKQDTNYLKNYLNKLNEKKLTDNQTNEIFKEEFARLISQ